MGGRAAFAAHAVPAILWSAFLAATAPARGVGGGAIALALAVLAGHLVAGGLSQVRRPADPVARSMAWTLTLLGATYAGRLLVPPGVAPDAGARAAWLGETALYLVLMAWLPAAILGFFPVRRARRPGVVLAVAAAAGLAGFSIHAAAWQRGGYRAPVEGPSEAALTGVALANDLFVFVYFLSLALLARRSDVRRRARVVLVAVSAYVAVFVIFRDLPRLAGHPGALGPAAQALLSLTLPAALGVAVTRYRLFEVDRLIRRGAAYGAASLLLVGLVLAAVPPVVRFLNGLFPGTEGVLTTAIVSLLLALLFDPLRRRAQRALTQRAPANDDPRAKLAGIVADLGDAGDDLPRELVRRLALALQPDRTALWLFGEGAAPVEPIARGAGTPRTAGPASSTRPVGPLDRASVLPLVDVRHEHEAWWPLTEAGGDVPHLRGALGDRLRGEGFVAAVPLLSHRREPIGLLALGPRRGGEPWLPEEQTLVLDAAAHAAVALDRAALARRVEEDRLVRERVLGHLAGTGGGALYECDRCGTVAGDDAVVCPNDGHPLKLTLAMPRLLDGRYRLDKRLGQGGMGIVYQARDVPLERDVAVKLIRADQLSDAGALARFRREARLTARLDHPSVITVYDYGELPAGGSFLVMELLAGGSLRDELSGTTGLGFRETSWVLDRTLDALAAAHAASLVHRDLKPDNLFVARAGPSTVLKVVDFGLAREVRSTSAEGGTTTSGTLIGTEGYIAPEVLAGAEATPASDLWAVAVTGFELLTNRRPRFAIETPPKAIARDVVEALSLAAPECPAPWARVLASGLPASPDDRPVSAFAWRRALRKAAGRIAANDEVQFRVRPVSP